MKAKELTCGRFLVEMTKEELNVFLQCLEEARDRFSENDIQTLMNSTSQKLEDMALEMQAILV